ncbi:hypothetical protein B0O99DRAFT_596588 [Bisporella sp. PMI_857]|nr:hypothetical protein B0O99DRAFT_596588 [Bisporella sp. PMI_857]
MCPATSSILNGVIHPGLFGGCDLGPECSAGLPGTNALSGFANLACVILSRRSCCNLRFRSLAHLSYESVFSADNLSQCICDVEYRSVGEMDWMDSEVGDARLANNALDVTDENEQSGLGVVEKSMYGDSSRATETRMSIPRDIPSRRQWDVVMLSLGKLNLDRFAPCHARRCLGSIALKSGDQAFYVENSVSLSAADGDLCRRLTKSAQDASRQKLENLLI